MKAAEDNTKEFQYNNTKEFFKQIRGLSQKKYRLLHQAFVVEGAKNVLEVLQSNLKVKALIALPEFLTKYPSPLKDIKIYEVDIKVLSRLSNIKTNNSAIAVVEIPKLEQGAIETQNYKIDQSELHNKNTIYLALDRVSDPSNFGAILRVADWFAVDKIFCSKDTVDIYNPKVIQASMGSFARVNVEYLDLEELFENTHIPIYGTGLCGQNIYSTEFAKHCIVVFGNESKGISKKLLPYFDKVITIPKYGKAESLNVATAAAVVCSVLNSKIKIC